MDIEKATQAWRTMQGLLLDQLGTVRFNLWFNSLEVYMLENHLLVMHAKDKYVTDHLNSHYKDTLYFHGGLQR